MSRILKTIIAGLMLAVLISGASFAQGDTDSQLDQLRTELDRTDELILHAREAVHNSGSAVAAQALEQAEKLQSGAREAFHNRAWLLALRLTRKAREQASLAISNSRMSEQLEGVVLSRLERARDLLERIIETLPHPPGPTAAIILERARLNLVQGWDFYRQRRFRAAVKMVEQVEQAGRRLLSIAQLDRQSGQTFEFRLENVERLLQYARELLSDCASDRGREHLRQAEHSLQRAREFHAQHRPRPALIALGRAKEAARKAAQQCQDTDRLEQRHLRLKSELDRAWEALAESASPNREDVRHLLEQAATQLQLVGQYLSENRLESAQLSLQAAQLALRQAQRYLTGSR